MPGLFGIISPQAQTKMIRVFDVMQKTLKHQEHYKLETIILQDALLGKISIRSPFPLKKISINGNEFVMGIDGYIYEFMGEPLDYNNLEIGSFYNKLVKKIIVQNQSKLEIKGNYLISIYDIEKKRLHLFTDKIGTKSCYYFKQNENLYFSQEAKGIVSCVPMQKEINWDAVSTFLHFGYILGEETFIKDMYCLSSASELDYELSNNQIEVRRYWYPSYTSKDMPYDEALEKLHQLLKKSIEEKSFPNNKIINPISGGLDSRLILGILHKHFARSKNIEILPVTYAQKFSQEYKIAKKVCKKLNIPGHILIEIEPSKIVGHFEKSVWLTDGFAQMNNAHLLLFKDYFDLNWDFVFNGIYGGPTNYAALYYQNYHIDNSFTLEEKVNDIQQRVALKSDIYTSVITNKDFKDSVLNINELIKKEFQKFENVSDIFANQRDAFFIENRMRRGIVQGAIYKFFWEEQLPLSNYDLYDFYLKIPPSYKLERKLLKDLIKTYYPDLARIKENNTGLNLFQVPGRRYKLIKKFKSNFIYYMSRISRGKISIYDRSSYAHYQQWLRKSNDFQQFYSKYLFDTGLAKTGYVNKDELKKLFDNVLNGGIGYYHLMRLATLSIWFHHFYHNQK